MSNNLNQPFKQGKKYAFYRDGVRVDIDTIATDIQTDINTLKVKLEALLDKYKKTDPMYYALAMLMYQKIKSSKQFKDNKLIMEGFYNRLMNKK